MTNWAKLTCSITYCNLHQPIKVLFSIQTNNNNIHTFVNINTERAGNKVILLI